MKYPIKLGKKMSMEGPEPSKGNDTHYPSLYLVWDDNYELPESGTMTVRFKKRTETNRKDKDGMHQSVDLDITEIVEVGENKKKSKTREAVMDDYKDEVMSKGK